jgi:transcriptional regulator GlxA family with amidase domain
MLANTRRSVGQISVMVGYADMRSFRSAFREYAGMSPSQYRHKIAGGAKIGD